MKMMKIVSSCSFFAYVVTAQTEPPRSEESNMLRAVNSDSPNRADFADPYEIADNWMAAGQPDYDSCLYINGGGPGWWDYYCTSSSWIGALCEWRGSSKPSIIDDGSWNCTASEEVCFHYISTDMTWWDAITACEGMGSGIKLARSLDQEEQQLLEVGYTGWLAGFRESGYDSQWYWQHGGDATPVAAAAASADLLEYFTETDTLTILEHMLLENGVTDGNRRRKRQAGATDTNADTVSSISDQMALTGCWCPKLNELSYNGKGEARDDYDQKCRHMASCIRRVNECGACNGLDVSDDMFSVTYDAVANTFDCNVNGNTACEQALCTCQMEWGVSVIEQIKEDGMVMKSEAANLDVSDTCVASQDSWTFVC